MSDSNARWSRGNHHQSQQQQASGSASSQQQHQRMTRGSLMESRSSGGGGGSEKRRGRSRSGSRRGSSLGRNNGGGGGNGLTGKISTLFRREASRERRSSRGRSPADHVQRLGAAHAVAQAARATGLDDNENDEGDGFGYSRQDYGQRVVVGSSNDSAPAIAAADSKSAPRRHGRRPGRRSNNHTAKQRSASQSRYDTDDRSVGEYSTSSRNSQRLFYSSNADDDDSEDSYESRLSSAISSRDVTYDDTTTNPNLRTIRRYRGFSTSIQSLFLDEPLVCASMGCFGLVLSNRTEYLLQLRTERRGNMSPRKVRNIAMPSRMVALGLLLLIIALASTFVVFGFGNGSSLAADYYQGHDYYDDNDKKNNNNQNNNNNNNQYYEDNEAEWDDYLANNDDKYNNGNNKNDNNNQGDDGGNQQQDDGYYNYYGGGDDQQQNNNDDGGAWYNNNNNDDQNNLADDGGGWNNNNNYADDQNYAAANDDQQQQQQQYDDANYNNNNNNVDDYYVANDDGGRRSRRMEQQQYNRQRTCPIHGIFKLRDAQMAWAPVVDFVKDEWNRAAPPAATVHHPSRQRRRRQSAPHRRVESDGSNNDQGWNDLASNIRVALIITFLMFLGILGRRRRMRTRFYLVRARAQEDHLYYASALVGEANKVKFQDTREDQYEGACSHTLCGCYPVDTASSSLNEDVAVTDNGLIRGKTKRHNQDIIARGFDCLMMSCCGFVCKCWFQALSICALAQEAREMRLLVPPRYQRIDYITHQPFHEYQKSVNDLRLGWVGKARRKAGIMLHFDALSRLSRYILLTFTVTTVLIIATLCFNPKAAFSWQDAVVLTSTFGQSFLVIFIVHWIFYKSDLSLDAVIKLFAAGFCIAVPAAFVFEGLLVNTVLLFSWTVYGAFVAMVGDGFGDWVYRHWRAIWIFGELFNAYVVAAATEELCKYYTFRTVEHPDLLFLTGLNRFNQDNDAVDGGVVQYPFGSHKVERLNRTNSFESAASRSQRSRQQRSVDGDVFEDDQPDVRTYRQKAMAITTGMICVAVGLACAENFLYVFLLGGAKAGSNGQRMDEDEEHRTDLVEEWIVLFFRSIFPIHALAAAMQSINMIRKFVEGDAHGGHRIGVGRIILPAVLVHGSFDAVLMGINVYMETAWDRYLEENEGNITDKDPYNSVAVNIVAWMSITLIMFAGMAWYYRENRAQRLRLILLEEKDKAAREDPNWRPPAATRQEAEII